MEFHGIEVTSALVVHAHADDAEYGLAGTVAAWTRQGVAVTYCMVTNGASGSSDKDMTRAKLAEIRAREQQNACDVLGVKELIQLGFEDGYLEPNLELRKAVARVVRQVRPDIVLTPHDPRQRVLGSIYVNHPDHLAVGEVVLRSMNPDASTRLMFPELWTEEGLDPHLPRAVMLSHFMEGGVFVDISETLETKVEALACHVSQGGAAGAGFVRQAASGLGIRAGSAAAEAFDLIRLR